MYLMNRFFDGEFLSYGTNIMGLSDVPQEQRVDPMVYVFPRVTKCIFHKYGAGGSLQTHDSLCILPLNIVNEKTYVFIWFWYWILLVLLVGLMILRLVRANAIYTFMKCTILDGLVGDMGMGYRSDRSIDDLVNI